MFGARVFVATVFLSGAVLSGAVLAEFFGPGAQAAMSVESAKDLADGSRVVLEGHLIDELDRNFFMFRDASGEVRVEIDKEIWRGQPIGPGDAVRIHGAVDQSRLDTEIDASHLEVLSDGD